METRTPSYSAYSEHGREVRAGGSTPMPEGTASSTFAGFSRVAPRENAKVAAPVIMSTPMRTEERTTETRTT